MPYVISVQGDSSLAEKAAVIAAFNQLITALHSGTAKHVDAGGTLIDGQAYGADESNPAYQQLPQGTAW